MAKRTAIIDIGSNSIRLVIYEKTSRFAFHLLNETKSRVRISEDSYRNSAHLQEKAMQRTLSALIEFQTIIQSYKVRKTFCVATSALRDAPNRQYFLDLVKKNTGFNIKVISGEKEAYYGGLACANLLAQTSGLSIDIGGGSTEFTIISNRKITHSFSLNLGTVRLKELFFDTNKLEEAKDFIDTTLKSQLPNDKLENLIGIGGTFRAVSQLILEMTKHPLDILHGFEFSPKILKQLLKEIFYADDSQLKTLGIKKERFDVIRPGAFILLRVIKYIEVNNIICSSAGVREGVFLHDLLRHSRFQFPHNYNISVVSLADRFIVNPNHASQREKVALKIAKLVQSEYSISENELRLIKIAAKLLGLGKNINSISYHLHSQLIIENGLKYGFTHEEIVIIATLVRFHKKKRTNASYHESFGALLPSEEKFTIMSFIIALSEALLVHHPRNIDFTIRFENQTLTFEGERLYLAQERSSILRLPKNIYVQFKNSSD